jgi:hypothetical protein
MATRMAPSLQTVEGLVAEVEQWYERTRKVRQRMSRVKLGSEAYQDLLSELWVELDWLKMKAEVATDAIDEYQESLPEDE